MKDKIKHYAKEIVIFFIVMTIFANIVSLYKSNDLNKEPLKIKNITLLDDSKYILPHAKPILIHFWATWCPTCKVEAPNIEFISKHFNVVTIAVDSGTNNELNKYLDEQGYSFNVVNDEDKKLSQEFNIAGYPTTFIYNGDKKLIFSEVGYTSIIGLYIRMWWASF